MAAAGCTSGTPAAPSARTAATDSPTSAPTPLPPPAAPQPRVLFFGHRGAGGEAPENTLAAFQRGLEAGADAVELDVHLSQDGELAVMHDPRLDRTSDGNGLIKNFTMADLRKLNAAAKYKGPGEYGMQPIPTLQQVYDLVGGKKRIVIEIKLDESNRRYPGIEQKVIERVRRNNAVTATTVGSFDIDTLKEIQRLEPGLFRVVFISTAYLGEKAKNKQGPEQIAAELKAAGVQGVGVEKSFLTQAMVDGLKAVGLQVGAWTVDDLVEMWKLIDLGVETITTNRPSLLIDKYRQGKTP